MLIKSARRGVHDSDHHVRDKHRVCHLSDVYGLSESTSVRRCAVQKLGSLKLVVSFHPVTRCVSKISVHSCPPLSCDRGHLLSYAISLNNTNMEDDLTFGASIWAATNATSDEPRPSGSFTSEPESIPQPNGNDEDAFDDFDFDAPVQATASALEDDDFGDFGDFEETAAPGSVDAFAQPMNFDEDAFGSDNLMDWEALRLNPLPSTSNLKRVVEDVLQPVWSSVDVSQFLTDEKLRQVGGLNQTLVTPERQVSYILQFQLVIVISPALQSFSLCLSL